jgi:hypothetical protein
MVGYDLTTGFLQTPTGDGIPFQHEALAWSKCQYIWTHSGKLCTRNLDKLEITSLKFLPERHGKQLWIDDGNVVIDDADE